MQRLLEQLIICINFTGMLESDVEEVVKETRTHFIAQGFRIREGFHKNINVEINDPEKIEGSIPSTTDVIKKYVYNFQNIDINFTKTSIDISVMAGVDYQGFEVYKQYISYIINKITSKFADIVTITRVGVRKINSLFLKDISVVKNYFNQKVFSCVDVNESLSSEGGKILLSGTHLTICNDNHKINLATEMQVGEAQEAVDGISNTLEVYRLILDIDAYWDSEIEAFSDINEKLSELSNTVTNVYQKCLNTEFNSKLFSGIANTDDNIFGGVK